MGEVIKLNNVIYNKKARGEWCAIPYPNHPKGCPNISKCIEKRNDFNFWNELEWYAIMEKFDLKSHSEKMKLKHPNWTERQCRNLLYWQGGVRKRLREKTFDFANADRNTVVLLDIPEASGVDVFETMKDHGIILERHNPDNIIKIMFVGKVRTDDHKRPGK